MVRVGFAGTAHTHPFSDARNLLALGCAIAAVWDDDDPIRRDDFAREFRVPVVSRPEEVLEHGVDLVIATPRPARAASVIDVFANAGIPLFMNKTIASSVDQLTAVDRAISRLRGPFFSSSVLRFAPSLRPFAAELADRQLLALRCDVVHDIAPFLLPERAWQDDPTGAGGTLVNMGIHGWELLDVVLPGVDLRLIDARSVRSIPERTRSEDVGVVLTVTPAGIPVTLQVAGAPGAGRYRLEAVTTEGPLCLEIAGGDPMVEQGFVGLAESLLDFVATSTPPVQWPRTRRVYQNALGAAVRARGHWLGDSEPDLR